MKTSRKAYSTQANRLILIFVLISAILLAFTFWYTRVLISKMQDEELLKIKSWGASMQQQEKLIDYTRTFFAKLELEERKYAIVWSYAYERLLSTNTSPEEFDFIIRIISENKTPFVVVDSKGKLIESRGSDLSSDSSAFKNHGYNEQTLYNYTPYDPISVYAEGEECFFYYKPSATFQHLQGLLDELSRSFELEAASKLVSVPVLFTDSSMTKIIKQINVDKEQLYTENGLKKLLKKISRDNPPLEIDGLGNRHEKMYILYESSPLLKGLRFLPFTLSFALLALLIGIVFLFNLARRNEQNQVWWGMSKETAHQLGTPLSSLLAWIEYYKMQRDQPLKTEDLTEMEKDVLQLQMIAQRFSKIGSIPELKSEDIIPVINRAIAYLKIRTSKRTKYYITPSDGAQFYAYINADLFEWVMENLCKNAVNAIGGKDGEISIDVHLHKPNVIIDISDNGKGMPKNLFSTIFEPGFTSKSRGWGLGLTLCKRIICDYHKGKIFVKSSVINEGTTFRIILNAAPQIVNHE